MRDRGKTNVTETWPGEIEARDLADLEIAAAFHEHAVLTQIQNAAHTHTAAVEP
ncbi:MAG: hypothetical protein ACLP01_20345 [Solirubrobacteraceae bacterium]